MFNSLVEHHISKANSLYFWLKEKKNYDLFVLTRSMELFYQEVTEESIQTTFILFLTELLMVYVQYKATLLTNYFSKDFLTL